MDVFLTARPPTPTGVVFYIEPSNVRLAETVQALRTGMNGFAACSTAEAPCALLAVTDLGSVSKLSGGVYVLRLLAASFRATMGFFHTETTERPHALEL